MAESDLSGFNGDVTLPSGHGGEAFSFTVQAAQATKDTSRYGNSRFTKIRGGALTISGQINVRLRKGAAGTTPNFVAPSVDGSSATLQLDTGCTLAGAMVMVSTNVNHTFADPAIDGQYNYQFNGDVTEVWATGA